MGDENVFFRKNAIFLHLLVTNHKIIIQTINEKQSLIRENGQKNENPSILVDNTELLSIADEIQKLTVSAISVAVFGAPSSPTHWVRYRRPKLNTSLDPA